MKIADSIYLIVPMPRRRRRPIVPYAHRAIVARLCGQLALQLPADARADLLRRMRREGTREYPASEVARAYLYGYADGMRAYGRAQRTRRAIAA